MEVLVVSGSRVLCTDGAAQLPSERQVSGRLTVVESRVVGNIVVVSSHLGSIEDWGRWVDLLEFQRLRPDLSDAVAEALLC